MIVVGSAKEIWTIGRYSRQEDVQKGEIVSRRISLRYTSAIRSGEGVQSLASGMSAQKNRSGPSDLEQVPVSRRIGQELHEVYHWESRGQGIRSFHRKSPGKIWTVR
jgi:hypothetical protein